MNEAKVCMLTSVRPALDSRMFYREAQSLRQAGYEVTLIAPLNSEGFLTDVGANKKFAGEATVDGVKIIGYRKQWSRFGKVQTALNLLSLLTLGKLKLGTNRHQDLIDKGIKLKADVYHCNDEWSLYAGVQIKRELEKQGRTPQLIYDVYEYPGAVYPAPNIFRDLYERVLRKISLHFAVGALKYLDYIITANQISRGYFLAIDRFLQTEVIYNCRKFSILKSYIM